MKWLFEVRLLFLHVRVVTAVLWKASKKMHKLPHDVVGYTELSAIRAWSV